MPGTAVGFSSYPQRPSVSPQAVGSMLMQRSQMQQSGGGPPGMGGGQMQSPMGMQSPAPNGDVGRMLSDSGMDDTPIGGMANVPSAVFLAAQGATARAPAVMQGSQPTAPSPLTEIQLRKMGVSDAELQLLRLGGGIK